CTARGIGAGAARPAAAPAGARGRDRYPSRRYASRSRRGGRGAFLIQERGTMHFLEPSHDSIIGRRIDRGGGERSRWFPVLMLGWSVWIFVTPLYESKYFPDWLWPTVA